ncbi:MAG: AraC family transcriptional regulator [Roseburia sp.]
MKCYEKGTLSKSTYYFFSPTEDFQKLYTHMLVCGHFYCDKSYKIVRHGDAFPLFVYIISGSLHIQYNEHTYNAEEGNIVLLNCTVPHSYYCNSECEFTFFHYDGPNAIEMTDYLIKKNQSPIFIHYSNKDIGVSLLSLIDSFDSGEKRNDTALSCLAHKILCQLYEYHSTSILGEDANISDTVKNVIDYMKSNYHESITIKRLATHVNISPSYLSHIFRDETGCSPIEYLARLRINMAKTILRSTNRSVTDIAISLGYSSTASFINAFTKRVGISPGHFRKTTLV